MSMCLCVWACTYAEIILANGLPFITNIFIINIIIMIFKSLIYMQLNSITTFEQNRLLLYVGSILGLSVFCKTTGLWKGKTCVSAPVRCLSFVKCKLKHKVFWNVKLHGWCCITEPEKRKRTRQWGGSAKCRKILVKLPQKINKITTPHCSYACQ